MSNIKGLTLKTLLPFRETFSYQTETSGLYFFLGDISILVLDKGDLSVIVIKDTEDSSERNNNALSKGRGVLDLGDDDTRYTMSLIALEGAR